MLDTDATMDHAHSQGRNTEYRWDGFDPDSYVEHNYRTFRSDDRQVLAIVRDFFTEAFAVDENVQGIDVGSGPSIIPALSMLPFCKTITLWEHGASNRRWLEGEVASYGSTWDPMWDELRKRPAYRGVTDPRGSIASRVKVNAGSVFDLPARQWGLGTMFFVACSLSRQIEEFEQAVSAFLGGLLPGAPFALACMEGSTGYSVAGQVFPSVSVGVGDIQRCLHGRCESAEFRRIGMPGEPLRPGYTGMVIATGRVLP